MKKIKNIVYIALLSLLVVSCEDNTDSITNPGEINGMLPQEIKVGFTDDNSSVRLLEGETVNYRIGMPSAIAGSVEVSLNVTSSDGSVEGTYPTSITLESGQSAVRFDVTPTDDGVGESENYTIEITGVRVNLDSGESYFVHNGETKRMIEVKDIPLPIVTVAGDLVFNFTWSGTNDLDCRLLDNPPTTIFDTGYSTTPGETVILADAVAGGDYLFTVRPWTVNDAAIDYTIEVVAPTETKTYSGTFLDLTGGWAMEFIALNINKATRGTVVTYMITQP